MAGGQGDVQRVLEQLGALEAGPSDSLTPWNSNSSARSNSPARRRGTVASGSSSASVMATPGWASRKRAMASGMSVAPAVGKEARRSRPPRTSMTALRSASAASSRARMLSAWSMSTRPAAVGRTPRRSRSTRVAPVSASSVAMACDTAEGVYASAAAARRERALRGDLGEHPQPLDAQH